MPEPLSVNRLVLATVWPLRSRTLPLVTLTFSVAAPRAVAEPNRSVPPPLGALTLIEPPVRVVPLAPESKRMALLLPL